MKPHQIIRTNELAELLSVSTTTLWRMEQRGEIPKKRQISKRVVGWFWYEIEEWLENRTDADPITSKS